MAIHRVDARIYRNVQILRFSAFTPRKFTQKTAEKCLKDVVERPRV